MRVLILLLISMCAQATEYIKVPYQGAYDGDTIYSELDLPKPLNEVSVRIYGIDTPEKGSRAKCTAEASLSEQATSFIEEFIGQEKYLYLKDVRWDKYGGRILARVFVKRKGKLVELSPIMLQNGYAVEYYGEKKEKDWCNVDQH